MSRSRPTTLQKTEKENENKNIKRKLKTVQPKVCTGVIYHAVADNVERVGTVPEKRPAISPRRGRLGSHVYPRHPTPEPDTYIKTIGMFPNHKPLSPYMSAAGTKTRKHGKSALKSKLLSPIKDSKIEEENVAAESPNTTRAVSVLELYTPRHGLSLKESSSDNVKCKMNLNISPRKLSPHKSKGSNRSPRVDMQSLSSGSSTYLNLELDICSLNSPESKTDVFHTAPLLTVPSAPPSLESSATLIRKFRNVLERQQKTMPDDEINVIKEVLKTDERSMLLKFKEPDPSLISDILRTQLQGIVHHEKVVKTALKKLSSVPRVEETELCGLQKLHSTQKNIATERHSPRKHHRKSLHSDENSLPPKPSFEFQEMALFQEQCDFMTDIQSSPRHRKSNDYAEKVGTLKRCGNPFEDFVKSTLPLKRKVTTGKITSQMSYMQDVVHDDFEVNIIRNELAERREHRRSKSARRPQVDVTFKNVPSLEKEILILKALGERLEATLKRTLSEPSLSDLCEKKGLCAPSSFSSLTKELQKIDSSIQVYAGRRTPLSPLIRMTNAVVWRQTKAGSKVYSKGLRHEVGIIYEFLIVSKTIDELKSDAESNFYIPMIDKSGVLERTSFKQLTEEPNELMRHLKPKSNNLVFNVLDHDPMFFNSFLLPNLSSVHSDKMRTESFICQPPKERKSKDTIVIVEGGDSTMLATESLKHIYKRNDPISTSIERPMTPILKKKTTEKTKTTSTATNTNPLAEKLTEKYEIPKLQPLPFNHNQLSPPADRSLDTQIRSAQRNRTIRRTVTPMPLDAYDEHKNNLLKTILVGTVQISIFLVLIMAITYPDVKC